MWSIESPHLGVPKAYKVFNQDGQTPVLSSHLLTPSQSSGECRSGHPSRTRTPPWPSGFLGGPGGTLGPQGPASTLHSPSKASTHFTWFPRTAYSSGVPPFCKRQGQPTLCLLDPHTSLSSLVWFLPCLSPAHLAPPMYLSLVTSSFRKPFLTALATQPASGFLKLSVCLPSQHYSLYLS